MCLCNEIFVDGNTRESADTGDREVEVVKDSDESSVEEPPSKPKR